MGTWMWILLIVALLLLAGAATGARADVFMAELRDLWHRAQQFGRH